MAEFPYLPIWTDAYLADTTHLHTEEHGAYLLLLFAAWRNADCSLPDDDATLARLAGLTAPKWKAMKPIIMAFWTLDKRKKKWVQKRLKEERQKATVKKAKARDSAASRWKDKKKTHANAMRSQCYPEPEPEPYEKANAFSERAGAKKKSAWVSRRTHTDAALDFIKELNGDGQEGTGGSGEVAHGPLRVLSAVGNGRR